MSSSALVKIAAKTAKEVCGRFTVDQDAKQLLTDQLSPKQYVDLLIEKEHLVDALKFLAYALPKREAVWWACQCVRGSTGANPPAKAVAALQAAEKWVADPSEQNRTPLLTAAQSADFATPAGCVALAVFWSGGKHAPPEAKLQPPAEDWTAHAVSGAVISAAAIPEPTKAPEKFRKFLALGLEVGAGTSKWK